MTLKRVSLNTAIVSTIFASMAGFLVFITPNGGERFPGYDLLRALELPAKITLVIAALLMLVSYATVGLTAAAKNQEPLTKQLKYSQLRKLSLAIAAIPGIVLTPMILAAFVGELTPTLFTLFSALTALTVLLVLPGGALMVGLFIRAVIIAKRPALKEVETTKTDKVQIALGVIAAALPFLGFLDFTLNHNQPCDISCPPFDATFIYICLALYAVAWLIIAIFWFKGRKLSLR
ncbi:MAG: hypothetical protein RIS26_2 [Actinomycetota bacterium]